MTLPARAAAVRGDDYQYVFGLCCAGRLLVEPQFESVSIEDSDGGAFDDVVLRATPTSGWRHEYNQLKSGNYRETIIDTKWLLTSKSTNGRSPLQHFHSTWTALVAAGKPFVLRLVSNKNFDHNDPLLGRIDQISEQIPVEYLRSLRQRSKSGKSLGSWAAHLGVDVDQIIEFLADVEWVAGGTEGSRAREASNFLRTAGFRHDDDAITRGVDIVRTWVKTGAGVRTKDDVRAEFATAGLLARTGELVLAVHAIDKAPLPHRPNAEIDIVGLYPDVDPFERRELIDPNNWKNEVLRQLDAARDDLRGFRSRHLHVIAQMRLPMYFAVGRTFSDVAGWVVSTDQRGVTWSTASDLEPAMFEVRSDLRLHSGPEVAVAVALAQDPTRDIQDYIDRAGLPVGRFVTFSSQGAPHRGAVPGPGWAVDWVRQARDKLRHIVGDTSAPRIHLFLAAPAGLALILGHDWNLLPATIVYDYAPSTSVYVPTVTFGG